MHMKKRFASIVVSVLMLLGMVPQPVFAQDYSDTSYWTSLCTSSDGISSNDKEACQGFYDYMQSQSSSLKENISSIDSQREEIASNIEEYAAKIKDYQSQIDTLKSQIDALQTKIDDKQTEINHKEDQITDLRTKVKKQIVNSQPTMRVHKEVDILMGAKTFADLLRIANGLTDITEYNDRNLKVLASLLNELNEAKKELTASQQDLKDKQDDVLSKQYEAQVIEEEYKKQSAELASQRASIVSNISEIQETMKAINSALGQVTASAGWTYPVPGVKMTPGAGTWNYDGGGRHYGEDFGYGVEYGTSYVVAAANGVVLMANDAGCGYGGLGDYCPVVGGGNEILLLVVVNGRTYGVKYYHLLTGSFSVKTGQVVNAGDRLANVGSSGNSTGPHCHICVYDVGDAASFSSIAQNWNGDMAMNTGWNTYTERICENGASVPCKVRPESVFGTGW